MEHVDSTGRTAAGRRDISRRAFLRGSLVGAAGLGLGGFLAACGSSSKSATTATTAAAPASGGTAKNLGSLSVQLEWIENFNWAGMYIADSKGYYKAAGIDVNLIAGGPSITPTTVVLGGKADVGMAGADVVAAAILKGAPFKIFASQYQKSPYIIMSKASDSVKTPQQLVGRKVAVSTEDLPSFDAFLAINGVDKTKVDVVPAPDVSTPLYKNNSISASLEFFEAPMQLQAAGIAPYSFDLSAFGYDVVSDAYFATTDMISKHPDKLMALLEGDSKGWAEQVKNPAEGATLGVQVYGKSNGLILAQEIQSATTQNSIIQGPDTAQYGLLSLGPQMQAANIKSLAAGNLKITAEQLFDDSIITKLYKEHPELLSAS